MAWPVGNDFWKIRTKDGRDKIYSSPEELAEAANEYFQWCLDNPYMKNEFNAKFGDIVQIPTMRPMSLSGLCNFLDMSVVGFKEYGKREDFSSVYTRIREIIDTQQFDGAAIGSFNASIIARTLGLADKKETETTIKGYKLLDGSEEDDDDED